MGDLQLPPRPAEKIVMTPRKKTENTTIIMMERQKVEEEEKQESTTRYVAGGDHSGLVINKQAIQVEIPPVHLSLEFHVFLVNAQTGKHSQESRTLRFWFRDGESEPETAQAFFTELVSPQDFPRDYVGFIKKIMKMMQRKFETIMRVEVELRTIATSDEPLHQNDVSFEDGIGAPVELSEAKVLEIIESSYPNIITRDEIAEQTKHSAEDVKPWLEQLKEKGVIRETTEGEGKVGYTRVTQDDTALHVVKQMPTIHSNAQPTIAIITANYCEKLAMDSMILNKTTYVRYTTIGESNVYTLGNVGAHRVVCTKLPSVGFTRGATIAAGSSTTRLLGTFQQVEYVILCGVGGGVPHYTDGLLHVRLGDIVCSASAAEGSPVYWYCEPVLERRNSEEAEKEISFQSRGWKPVSFILQDMAAQFKEQFESTGEAPWLTYMEEGGRELEDAEGSKFERPPFETDRLFMPIGRGDLIQVQHPALPDAKYEEQPRIHLGPVGSGREVSLKRGDLAASLNLRAWDSPFDSVIESILGNRKDAFIAVRGIADYRDGSRGKDWQPYAALAAAAFTKALICALPPITPT